MILVVGGLGAGKRNYVETTLGFSQGEMACGVLDERPVLLDLQEMIRTAGEFPEDWLAPLLAKQVVVCCEVGCGVVPIDPAERRWRDDVGRVCARLATKADVVVRVVCGLPQVIKGQLPCR